MKRDREALKRLGKKVGPENAHKIFTLKSPLRTPPSEPDMDSVSGMIVGRGSGVSRSGGRGARTASDGFRTPDSFKDPPNPFAAAREASVSSSASHQQSRSRESSQEPHMLLELEGISPPARERDPAPRSPGSTSLSSSSSRQSISPVSPQIAEDAGAASAAGAAVDPVPMTSVLDAEASRRQLAMSPPPSARGSSASAMVTPPREVRATLSDSLYDSPNALLSRIAAIEDLPLKSGGLSPRSRVDYIRISKDPASAAEWKRSVLGTTVAIQSLLQTRVSRARANTAPSAVPVPQASRSGEVFESLVDELSDTEEPSDVQSTYNEKLRALRLATEESDGSASAD